MQPIACRQALFFLLLGALVVLLSQCRESPSPISHTAADSLADLAPNLGGGEDTVAVNASEPTSNIVNQAAWEQAIADYNLPPEYGLNPEIALYSAGSARIRYAALPITCYLEDLVLLQRYLQYPAGAFVTEDSGETVYYERPDDWSDTELAYPLVRENYLSDAGALFPNPNYVPLPAAANLRDPATDSLVEGWSRKLALYQALLIKKPAKFNFQPPYPEKYFFDAAYFYRQQKVRGWLAPLNATLNKAFAEVYNQINIARDSGKVATYTINLTPEEKEVFIRTLEHKALPAATLRQFRIIVQELDGILTPLGKRLATLERAYTQVAPLLDSEEEQLCQAVGQWTTAFIKDNQALRNQLSELAALPITQTSYDHLVQAREALRTANLALERQQKLRWEVERFLKILENHYFRKVKALEATFKARQLED
ncbi:MAG: hypothetical protein DA408_07765 [Bacteroidetes bacterium]|nr:MAG: hypothetical protein C7N36_03040 [Bacteroidota bacterium]PTM13145.1 MAG: hypothetical protein DA408_07765 [Bacteroidota bacterium]